MYEHSHKPNHEMLQVRLKKFLEMRGADGGPWKMICALPALWVGLIYEPRSQSEALGLIEDWTAEEREMLRVQVPRDGMKTPFRGGTFQVGQTTLGYTSGRPVLPP